MYESEDDLMEQQALTFNDLLNFAYQVAKGMEFLSAKNVRKKWTQQFPLVNLQPKFYVFIFIYKAIEKWWSMKKLCKVLTNRNKKHLY